VARLKGHQCEQQPQALRKANQDKTDSYCLDRQYVLPQAEFTDHQNVKTPEPKSDHRDAADTDHIGKDLSHGQLLRLSADSQGNRRRARNSRQHENGSMKILYAFDLIELNGDDLRAIRLPGIINRNLFGVSSPRNLTERKALVCPLNCPTGRA
jgi:hypothetical protein